MITQKYNWNSKNQQVGKIEEHHKEIFLSIFMSEYTPTTLTLGTLALAVVDWLETRGCNHKVSH
jgi:hypothetical protein